MLIFLNLLVSSFIQYGFTMECYKTKLPYERGREHENTLPTEICPGRCYIRSNKSRPKEIVRGCSDGFTDLPSVGCYIFTDDVWCLCDEDFCNFGPTGNGEFEQPHIRMTRSVPKEKIGLKREKRGFQHTLKNPFVEASEYEQAAENRDPETNRKQAVENLGVGMMKNDAHQEGKFSIQNDGELATDLPKVALRMGQIPQTRKQPGGRFSLHENNDKRYRGRHGRRSGSIFTRDGRVAHNTEEWMDQWEANQDNSRWSSEDDNYSSNSWGNRQREKKHFSDKHGNSLHSVDHKYNTKTKTAKKKYGKTQTVNDDYYPGSSWEIKERKDSPELDSWESEISDPIEIDDSFWDFESLAESFESDSQSVFPKSGLKKTTKAPRYRTTTTTRRPRYWRPTTTKAPPRSKSRQKNYKRKPTSPSRNTDRRPPGRSNNRSKPTPARPTKPTRRKATKRPVTKQQKKSQKKKVNNIPKAKQKTTKSTHHKKVTAKSNAKKAKGKSVVKVHRGHKDVKVHKPTTKRTTTTIKTTSTAKSTTTKRTTTKRTTTKRTTTKRIPTTTKTTSTTKTTTTTNTPNVKERTAKAEKQKSAIHRGSNSPLPGHGKNNEKCGLTAGKLHTKGCKNNPSGIFTHSPKAPPRGLTATTLQSVLQTALQLNTSTVAVHVKGANKNGTRKGQSDGYVGLSHCSRLDALYTWSIVSPLVIGLLIEHLFTL